MSFSLWCGGDFLFHYLREAFKALANRLEGRSNLLDGSKGERSDRLPSSLDAALDEVRRLFGDTPSFIVRRFRLGSNDSIPAALIYIDGLVDVDQVNQHLLKTMMLDAHLGPDRVLDRSSFNPQLMDALVERLITVAETRLVTDWTAVLQGVTGGETVIFVDGHDQAVVASTPGWAQRGVEEPTSESVVRGPREGFTETIKVNEAMIFRRIRNPKLRFEKFIIGRVTQTRVSLAYIKGIAPENLIEEVRHRLSRIDVDGIIESGYIEEFIEDSPWSPFPQTLRTERPDTVVGNLLEGRVAIMTDGTPFVLLLPVVFNQLLSSPEDYGERFLAGSLLRALRYGSFAMALLLPSIYIAITTFHQELLPTTLILAVAAARQGVPFPALVEALLLELLFEVLREAGLRLPRLIGPAVSIVGALVVGEAAVTAGLVSPAMVIVVAMTAISSFATPVFSFAIAARILRFLFMFSAAALGLFGIQLGLLLLLLHLVSLRSFGTPYMAPLAPLHLSDLKDVIIRVPHWAMIRRPHSIPNQDSIRQHARLRIRPPEATDVAKDAGPKGGDPNDRHTKRQWHAGRSKIGEYSDPKHDDDGSDNRP